MKILSTFACIVFAGYGTFNASALAGAVELTSREQPAAVIVIPDNPGDTEEFAASELKSYIEQISGAELPVVAESERGDETFISVGLTRLSESARERLAGEPADAFIVESVSNGIVLAGGGDSGRSPGTLFAVYDFLEQDLGCRWLGPGELWEHIPSVPSLAVTPADRLETPAMLYRICTDFNFAHGWSIKNKANIGPYERWPFDWIKERIRSDENPIFDSPGWSGVHSGTGTLLDARGRRPEDKPFQFKMLTEHPEWFPLLRGGSRHTDWFCHGNPEMNDLFADRLSQMLRERPYMDFVQLGEGDGYGRGACQCEACLDAVAPAAGAHETHRGIYSFRWRMWENTVAALLSETDPEKKLMGVAYGGAQEPLDPELIRPAQNVMMDYYTWADCRAHGYEHEPHVRSRDWIERWSAMTPAGMVMSEYHSRGSMAAVTSTMPRRFVRDMRYLRRNGFVGYRAFTGYNAWSLYQINRYAALKAAWNPDLDEDELVRDFCDHAFHEASEHMQRFIAAIEAATEAGGCGPGTNIAWTRNEEKMDEARRHLDAARAAAEGNETVQQRLVPWEVHFKYAALAGPGHSKLYRGAYREGDRGTRIRLIREGLDMIERSVEYAREMRTKTRARALRNERPDLRTVSIIPRHQRYLSKNHRVQQILARLEAAEKKAQEKGE